MNPFFIGQSKLYNAMLSGNIDLYVRDVRFGPKYAQIAPKRNKSGTFSDQISVHFSQNVLKSDLKKSWICPNRGQLDPIFAKI